MNGEEKPRQRRSDALINRLLETLLPTLFYIASALSAPSGHLPLEGKADDTRIPSSKIRRSRHLHSSLLTPHSGRAFKRNQRTAHPMGLTTKKDVMTLSHRDVFFRKH